MNFTKGLIATALFTGAFMAGTNVFALDPHWYKYIGKGIEFVLSNIGTEEVTDNSPVTIRDDIPLAPQGFHGFSKSFALNPGEMTLGITSDGLGIAYTKGAARNKADGSYLSSADPSIRNGVTFFANIGGSRDKAKEALRNMSPHSNHSGNKNALDVNFVTGIEVNF